MDEEPQGTGPRPVAEAETFGRLLESLRPDVERLCARLLGRDSRVEDAVSEVFLKAQQGFESYDPRRDFRPWLLSVGAHHCVDLLRRRGREARLFDPGELEPDTLAAGGPTPLAGLLQGEARRELLAAVDALPERYRAPLVLRFFADLDHEAIARILGVSRAQVSTLLFRGRRRLREALGGAAR